MEIHHIVHKIFHPGPKCWAETVFLTVDLHTKGLFLNFYRQQFMDTDTQMYKDSARGAQTTVAVF